MQKYEYGINVRSNAWQLLESTQRQSTASDRVQMPNGLPPGHLMALSRSGTCVTIECFKVSIFLVSESPQLSLTLNI